jgi:hypothetical protein
MPDLQSAKIGTIVPKVSPSTRDQGVVVCAVCAIGAREGFCARGVEFR